MLETELELLFSFEIVRIWSYIVVPINILPCHFIKYLYIFKSESIIETESIIDSFNSVKPMGIQQEFFVAMYLSNLSWLQS